MLRLECCGLVVRIILLLATSKWLKAGDVFGCLATLQQDAATCSEATAAILAASP
jgi:hypothetical protein